MKATKTTLAALVCASSIAAGLTSCSVSSQDARTSFDSFTQSSTYTLVGSAADFGRDSDVICNDSVSVVMPVTLNGQDAAQLRNEIIKRMFNAEPTATQNAINQWFKATAEKSGYKTATCAANDSDADGFTHISGYVTNLTPDFLVYGIVTDAYMPCAANGMTTFEYINYSMTQHSILTLEDLFTTNGLQQLPAVIAEQANNTPEYDNQVDITALPEGRNFYISGEGEIVFSYYPTEVAPHYLGTIRVSFYPYELSQYMTPRALSMFKLNDL